MTAPLPTPDDLSHLDFDPTCWAEGHSRPGKFVLYLVCPFCVYTCLQVACTSCVALFNHIPSVQCGECGQVRNRDRWRVDWEPL